MTDQSNKRPQCVRCGDGISPKNLVTCENGRTFHERCGCLESCDCDKNPPPTRKRKAAAEARSGKKSKKKKKRKKTRIRVSESEEESGFDMMATSSDEVEPDPEQEELKGAPAGDVDEKDASTGDPIEMYSLSEVEAGAYLKFKEVVEKVFPIIDFQLTRSRDWTIQTLWTPHQWSTTTSRTIRSQSSR
jgi:hypothetical protein